MVTTVSPALLRLGTLLALVASFLMGGGLAPPHAASAVRAASAEQAAALKSRVLSLKDFFDVYPNEVEDVSHSDRAVIAGITYAHAIELDRGIASLAYNTQ